VGCVTGRPHRSTTPTRGDVVAATTVALVLIPQSLAYAELAGLPVVTGLYTAVTATLAAGLIGSSRYLQTGSTALTSLLTLGGLTTLAEVGSDDYVGKAALLAIIVGVLRALLGLLRWGFVAYLMSQPVLASFTAAAALLIIASQIPAFLDAPGQSGSPVAAAGAALWRPHDWDGVAIGVGSAMVVVILLGRRWSPRFPGALVGAVGALLLSLAGIISITEVGAVPSGLPSLQLGLPWGDLPRLLVPGAVIAFVGFAEPASIARRYATEDREAWDPNRELIGQGLANLAAGAFSGFPAGGSFSRSSLNRLSGATSRWSGVLTGLIVLAFMPFASVLSELPKAALAGLVVASALPLVQVQPFVQAWRMSRPQFTVAVLTFLATLAFAPRVERGVLVGVGLSLAVHLWRELDISVETWREGTTLHVRPQGVLYFGSAPALEAKVAQTVATDEDVSRVVIHLERVGRLDVTGALVLQSFVEDLRASGTPVAIQGASSQAARLLAPTAGKERADTGGKSIR
jgi:SulP family sulfate permease